VPCTGTAGVSRGPKTGDCAHCGATFIQDGRGRPRQWCYQCLPPYDPDSHRVYMGRAAKLNYFLRSGIHVCCGQRAVRPSKPSPPPKRCVICEVVLAAGRRSLCGSEECIAERLRRNSRARRAVKDAAFRAMKRREYRKRRAIKRGCRTDPYDPLDIAERDRWRCGLCGQRIQRNVDHLHPRSLTMDHMIPLARGGDDVPENVQAAHRQCNSIKGQRFVSTGEQLRLIG
jgi:5-methylcytosine-specific restriction endonuclease McrA